MKALTWEERVVLSRARDEAVDIRRLYTAVNEKDGWEFTIDMPGPRDRTAVLCDARVMAEAAGAVSDEWEIEDWKVVDDEDVILRPSSFFDSGGFVWVFPNENWLHARQLHDGWWDAHGTYTEPIRFTRFQLERELGCVEDHDDKSPAGDRRYRR